MAEQRESRRVLMTKRLMKEALLELLEQKELVNISVTEICKLADVHRSTFYTYYSDQAELLRDLEQDCLDLVLLPSPDLSQLDEEQLLAETTAFFESVKRNERAFRILLAGSTSSDFSNRLIELQCSRYAEVGNDTYGAISGYAILYIAHGTVGLLREWVNTGFPIDSREIAEMMYLFSTRVAGGGR